MAGFFQDQENFSNFMILETLVMPLIFFISPINPRCRANPFAWQ